MSSEEDVATWSKEKLKSMSHSEITKLFSSILDFAEVAIDGKDRYLNFRSRVLKLSNDAIREIKKEIDTNYEVNYTALTEDLIVVKKSRQD